MLSEKLTEISPAKVMAVIFAVTGLIGIGIAISDLTEPTRKQMVEMRARQLQMEGVMQQERLLRELQRETGMSAEQIEALLSQGEYRNGP